MTDTVRLYRTGGHQALKLPHGFELPGTEAVVRRQGNRVILEPRASRRTTAGLLDYLASRRPLDETFPDVDEGLAPLDDVEL